MHIFNSTRHHKGESGGPRRPGTVAEALKACQDTFQRHADDGSALQYVFADVDMLCSAARRDRLAPETMLVDLKHTLDAVPELDRLEPERREEIRSRVVQYAIREYFADGGAR